MKKNAIWLGVGGLVAYLLWKQYQAALAQAQARAAALAQVQPS